MKKKIIIIVSISIILIITFIVISLFFSRNMTTYLPQINNEIKEESTHKEQENRFAKKTIC